MAQQVYSTLVGPTQDVLLLVLLPVLPLIIILLPLLLPLLLLLLLAPAREGELSGVISHSAPTQFISHYFISSRKQNKHNTTPQLPSQLLPTTLEQLQ